MKIGVALSGSGPGARQAHILLDALRYSCIPVEMVSATSLGAIPAYLWSRGVERKQADRLVDAFVNARGNMRTMRMFQQAGVFERAAECDFAISSVDSASGAVVIFSDTLDSQASSLRIAPLFQNVPAAFSSTLSPWRGAAPYQLDGLSLCDFALRYGCPFFPLKMSGQSKLLSITFAGGQTPAEIASQSLCALTGKNADLHYSLQLDESGDIETQIRSFVTSHVTQLYDCLLF